MLHLTVWGVEPDVTRQTFWLESTGKSIVGFYVQVGPQQRCVLVLQTEKVDAKCVTWQEANMKMELANLIFDDLIEDTALAFCDAHNMPIVASV